MWTAWSINGLLANGGTIAEYCNSSGQAVVTATSATRMSYSGLYQATGYRDPHPPSRRTHRVR